MCGTRTGKHKEKLGRKFNELYIALTGKEIYKDEKIDDVCNKN